MAKRDVQVRLPTLDRIIPPAQRKALLEQLGAMQVGRIKRRTASGQDVDGKAFKPYSASYAKAREMAGRETKRVQLWLTGSMMGSLRVVSATADRALLGFTGSSARVKLARRTRTRVVRNALSSSRETVANPTLGGVTHTFRETNKQVANALKARWANNGEGRNPQRRFFAFSSEDKALLMKHALRELTRMAGRALLGRALGRR